MKLLAAGCGLSLLMLLTVSTAGAAPPPSASGAAKPLAPGTYRQIDTVTKAVLPVGNQIVIAAGKGKRLAFSVNAVSQSSENGGFAVGILPASLPATWTRTSSAGNCRLTFEAIPKGVKVTQDAGFGDCGFGPGANATGTYVLRAETPLKT
jgi:hypothetical protein